MDVQIKYGNFVQVDSRMLTSTDGEQLKELLTTHKQFIISKIEALEAKMRADDPKRLIQPPRVWLMYLGPRDAVFNKPYSKKDDDTIMRRDHLNQPFRPLWDIVVNSDSFLPEVRCSGPVFNNPAGAYLLVRLR